MFLRSLRRFHCVLFAPILLCLLLVNRATPISQASLASLAETARPNNAALTFATYTIHGPTVIGPILINAYVTMPAHGSLFATGTPGMLLYAPFTLYVGPDSFTYLTCDSSGCTEVEANLNVVNQAPIAGADSYTVRGVTRIGPLMANDSDPDGDPINIVSYIALPTHGILQGTDDANFKIYTPGSSFAGTDSFTYLLCDQLQLCAQATVTLHVAGEGENDGLCEPCNEAIGGPVNVSNGNMYLQQTDHALPSIGPAINITRTFNSSSQTTGLFGRGWSSNYDESIAAYDSSLVRFSQGDGRAIYLGRPLSSSGAYSALEGDFHGQLSQASVFTLSMKDGSAEQFNSSGKLLSLADRNGNQTTLAYDSNGRLVSITDPFGRVLTVTTNSHGQVVSISDSLGTIATYGYGASNELLSVTYPDNSAFHFAYDVSFRLTTVTDALGNVIESHAYDGQGRALTSEKQNGVEHYSLNYVSDTETDVTDALGRITKYTFDKSKGRNVVTRVEGLCSCGGNSSQVQTWTYDNQLSVTSHTNALGQVVTYTYDANGNELTGTSVLGTSTFTYNQFSEVLTATDAMGGVSTNAYDAAGNLISVKDALNHSTTFTYDLRGELLTMTNALGKVTTLIYDSSGNISQTTDALGGVTKFAYDARGRLTSAADALNAVSHYAYDAAGRMNKITRPDSAFVTSTYDLAGRRTKFTDALNKSTNFAYDGAYRLSTITDAASNSVSYTYDLMSNLTVATDQLGRTTNFSYDEFNRPTTIIYPPAVAGAPRLQESVVYDAVANVTRRTDTAGRVTSFAYDNANRLTSLTDPLLQITSYEYNARSNLTALVDAVGQRYTFDYDALGRVTATTRAGMMMSFTYDAAGNRTQRTDYNNVTSAYTYDALNRLTKITYPDESLVTYSYDNLSRLIAATNPNGTVSFVYDNLGRVTSTTDVWGQAINYAYDANSNRTQMSFGATPNVTYSYDTLDRLTAITDASGQAVDYGYDATSKLISRNLPNNIVTSYTYDGLDRLTGITAVKGKKLVAVNSYQYNSAGDIIQNIDQGGAHSYSYDALDRLLSATYPNTPVESYSYDAVGNRASSQRSGSYSYQPFNRLAATSSANYSYDNNGNMLARTEGSGTSQFAWDFENRLNQVITPSSGNVTYKYDGLGRRIQRAPSSGVSTNFIYDGQDVVQDLNSDGSTVDYLNGPGIDNKISQTATSGRKETTLYYSMDQLGSTTALTNKQGHVTEQISYDSYGNSAGSTNTRYDFTGRERDSSTGLLYYRARWYDPQVGRFISEDPIALDGGINPFAYTSNSPQNRTDPSGLYEIDVHYYLTYYLARKTGCFTDDEAREIANGDQGVDENPATSPAYGRDDRQRQVNAFYHALHPGSHQPYLDAHWMNATMGRQGNTSNLGIYLHYLQDMFSHQGYTSSTWGHASGFHAADKTDSDVGKAMDMARATWDALLRFASLRGCHCKDDKGSDEMWRTVEEFSKASGGGPYDRRRYSIDEIDPRFLNNKIQILGVSRR